MEKIDVHVHVGSSDSLILEEGKLVTGKEVTIPNLLSQMDKNRISRAIILAFDI